MIVGGDSVCAGGVAEGDRELGKDELKEIRSYELNEERDAYEQYKDTYRCKT